MIKIVSEQTKYHRFALYYDYDNDKVEFCRSLKESFGWDRFSFDSNGPLKRWVFSESLFVPIIVEKFPETKINPNVMEIVEHEQKWQREQKEKEKKIDEIKIKKDTSFDVKGLKGKLYEYQKIGVEFLVESGGRAILSDEMGTGKSLQSLAFIKYNKFKRTLIVCPASVKFSWESEIKKWTNFSSIIIDSKTNISEIDHNVQIWVINYDILKKHFSQLAKIRFDSIIGDEAVYIKNQRSIRCKAFRSLSRNIQSVILLSGTPLLNRPSELFSLLNIIDPKTWSNWYSFARKYCAMRQTRWGMDTSGASNIEELHTRIKRYFIRRMKKEVLAELPPKTFVNVPVQLEGKTAKEYSVAANNLALYLRQYSGKQPPEIAKTMSAEKLARLNVLRQLSAMGKMNTAIELINNFIETGEKILVFSSFVEPLETLKNHFGSKAVMITGKTPVSDRKTIVKDFQTNKDVQIFLGGYLSAGTGVTLTAASAFLGIDLPWTPSSLSQSIDRLHRPGQEARNVTIYQLSAINTIDQDMKDTINHKQGLFDIIIDGKIDKEIIKSTMEKAVERILKNY